MFGSLSADDEDIRKRLIDTEPLVDTVVGALQDNDEGNQGVLGSGSVGSVRFWLHIFGSAKICGSKGTKYTFFKSPRRIQMCKNICRFFKPKCVFKKNWKCANPLKCVCAKIYVDFFAKIEQYACFCYKLSKNPMIGSKSKYRFNLI